MQKMLNFELDFNFIGGYKVRIYSDLNFWVDKHQSLAVWAPAHFKFGFVVSTGGH